jgi:4-amino-4-deoxy-L-arabinose transferase-like glycosyltransferase
LIGLLFLLPFAEITKDGIVYIFNYKGIISNGSVKESGILVSVLLGFILVLHVFAIFSFKKRTRQIRIIVISILLMICLCGLFSFYTYGSFSVTQISLKFCMAFPLVAIIIDYLAVRAIGKDEALIRSIDRIR